jgi:hypothetical protein
LVLLLAACTSVAPSVAPSKAAATPTALPSTADPWAEDLDQLDGAVRANHVSPFTIHGEAEWKAKLAEIRPKGVGASPDQQFVLIASVVALLDTHSGVSANGQARAYLHAYEVLFYKFSDGWFVIAAKDKSLVGTRLISIGGHPVAEVEATLRTLVPFDNESGFLDAVQGPFSFVEYLHGSGIVADPAKPQYVLERAEGTPVTVDFPVVDAQDMIDEFSPTGGDLVGAAPEAVARRGELVWTRLDAKDKAFLISVNDYGDTSAAGTAMIAALDSGKANRVVLDLRYLRGGSGDIPLLTLLKVDSRVNRKGGLTVLIGRENVSAATVVVRDLDVSTEALLVGEPTPARADNFLCGCIDIVLKHSGIVVTVPHSSNNNGDPRSEIAPDVPMALSSTDFFAGRDPVLDAALKGLTAP